MTAKPLAAVVSFRLGGPDGVSVAAAAMAADLRRLGLRVRTVAGAGRADRLLPGLGIDATQPPSRTELGTALDDAALTVVENLCSLPMNPAATEAVAGYLRGRRALLRHHDLPWQRERYAGATGWPPQDRAWVHATINDLSRAQLAERGIPASTLLPTPGDLDGTGRRSLARDLLRVRTEERVVLQPTRAIARKNVPAGLAVAAALGATYWLTGPAEEGFADELSRLLSAATVPVLRRLPEGLTMADAYAAADLVVLPSTWEGFGLPLVEAALHRRPAVVGGFPVAQELAALGLRWFGLDEVVALRRWLDQPDDRLLAQNQRLAREHFGSAASTRRLRRLLLAAGWQDLLDPAET